MEVTKSGYNHSDVDNHGSSGTREVIGGGESRSHFVREVGVIEIRANARRDVAILIFVVEDNYSDQFAGWF